MNAGDLMTRPVLATTRRAAAHDVALQFVTHGITGMPVIEDDGTVVGVISEADIITALIEGQNLKTSTADVFMSNDPVTVEPDTPVEEVMGLFEGLNVVRIPVTKNDKLVGIISRHDVIRSVVSAEFRTFGA